MSHIRIEVPEAYATLDEKSAYAAGAANAFTLATETNEGRVAAALERIADLLERSVNPTVAELLARSVAADAGKG